MKKILGRIIILLFSITILFELVSFADLYSEITYTNTDRTKIMDYNNNLIDLDNVSEVTIIQGKADQPQYWTNSPALSKQEFHTSIVNQPNVYCIEANINLSMGTYVVSEEKTILDPINAYVLNQNTSMANLENNQNTVSQTALNMILFSYITADESNLFGTGDYRGGSPFEATDTRSQAVIDAAYVMFENAKQYVNKIAYNHTPNVEFIETGDTVKVKVSGDFNKYKIYINGVDKGVYNTSHQYEIESFLLENDVNVKVVEQKEVYYAKYRVLSDKNGGAQQRLIVVTAVGSTLKDGGVFEGSPETKKDVSIQKFITAVNDINIGYSRADDANQEKANVDSDQATWKINNPIEIEKGDKVTYKICVYNNKSSIAKNVVVTEQFSDAYAEWVDTAGWIHKGGNTYQYTIGDLPGNTIRYLEVSLKYKAQDNSGQSIPNYANVSATNNATSYLTEDRDYIKMKNYEVSLEKFISEITDSFENDREDFSYREGHEEYNDDPSNIWKRDNDKVYVEPGDIVTYTIKIKNKQDTDVSINKIREHFAVEKMTFKGIDINGDNNYIDGTYDDNEGIVNLNSTITISQHSNATIKIKFEVIEKNERIKNSVSISEIYNKNGVQVSDKNDTDNMDSDYMWPKEYDISLEKFISEITDSIGNNREDFSYREGHEEYNDDPSNIWKRDNDKVYVEPGDIVTYTIKIKNKQDTDVSINKIREHFAVEKMTFKGIDINGDNNYIDGTYDDNEGIVNLNSTITISQHSNATIKIKFEVIEKNERIKNSVSTSEICNKNGVQVSDKNDTDNMDSDYMWPKEYKVSLEKFVTKVENSNDAYDKKINDISDTRKGKARNESWKKDTNKVYVEPKDIVTYKLILKNTGDVYAKISKITEDFNNIVLATTVNGNNGGTYDNTTKIISFNNPILLAPGAETEVTIQAIVEETGISGSIMIKNQATITELKNRNDIIVTEKPAEQNDNYDYDWVHTKKYSVSLEKFVTKIEAKDITGRGNHPIYKDTHKENNKPDGEVGDTVTYTIRIKNTANATDSENTIVAVTKLQETLQNLKADSITIISDNGTNAVYNPTDKKITFNNPKFLNPGESFDIKITGIIELETAETIERKDAINTAEIEALINKNKASIKDKDTNDNKDKDWVYTFTYTTSLEKYITSITKKGTGNVINVDVRDGYPEYSNDSNKAEWKENNAYTVSNGDLVTYTLKLRNGDPYTAVKFAEIKDTLPEGLEFNSIVRGKLISQSGNTIIVAQSEDNAIPVHGSTEIIIVAKVIEPSISLRILENTAKITKLTNNHGITILDEEKDNKDSDYIQLNYEPDEAIISGKVWNDKGLFKDGYDYNAKYESGHEKTMKDITVYLYRQAKGKIAVTKTDENGNYSFSDKTIENSQGKTGIVSLNKYEKNIKAKRLNDEGSWDDEFYSYYVVFEYDGLKYTSTPDGTTVAEVTNDSDYQIDSNASEDREVVATKRKDFNSTWSTISGENPLKYTTKNTSGYIPQSIHDYDNNSKDVAMQSSTNLINLNILIRDVLGDTTKSYTDRLTAVNKRIDQLLNVGLGLRGRDTFDLELYSDVYKTEVKVNGVQGVYKYNDNIIKVRSNDINIGDDIKQDTENVFESQMDSFDSMDDKYVEDRKSDDGQTVRETDTNDTRLEIYVTYKMTVKNVSNSKGYATKVINYFDKKYKIPDSSDLEADKYVAYYYQTEQDKQDDKQTELYATVQKSLAGTNCHYTIINMPSIQGETTEVYLKLKLRDASNTLKNEDEVVTYNMSEIYAYETVKTINGATDNEATRGLIDKDSAPGSAATETVRLTDGDSTLTTAGYYFKPENLGKLKYEDDTYATPTLYFKVTDAKRKITGNVFEDYTKLYGTDRYKSGNGKKDGIEPGINGIKVELWEEGKTSPTKIAHTGNDGNYTIEGFLPGKYILKFTYGNEEATFFKITPNTKSYNGEDFRSTNNTGKVGGSNNSEISELNGTANYWYKHNEGQGISTATDNGSRRITVTNNVSSYTDEKLKVLNDVREGKTKAEVDSLYSSGSATIINETYMYANTTVMKFEVEEVDEHCEKVQKYNEIYEITNMNFGIAEVPVTTVDLQKHVKNFSIVDSAGENIMAAAEEDTNKASIIVKTGITADKETKINTVLAEIATLSYKGTNAQGYKVYEIDSSEDLRTIKQKMYQYSLAPYITLTPKFKTTAGNVLIGVKDTNTVLDVSIEDDKLQGAKLQATYKIIANIYKELDFDGVGSGVDPVIKGVIDYIDNDLSYNEVSNSDWIISTDSDNRYKDMYTTKVECNSSNFVVGANGEISKEITLERVLSSTDATIEDIITSSIESYEYENIVKISSLTTTSGILKDRIRTPDRYIIIPGRSHDTATSETIAIHPPTGDSGPSLNYYIIATISLAIIAIGAFGIKKFVVKK